MNFNHLASLIDAFACAGLAIAAISRRERSVPQWAFAAGMLVLGAESACHAWSAGAPTVDEVLVAQTWVYIAKSLLPAPWLIFSLTYARGNAPEFLRRWRPLIAALALAPLAMVLLFVPHLIAEIDVTDRGEPTMIQFGWAGVALHSVLLCTMIAVLIDLEHTFRTAVGTMRWRIKYMLLGLAVLFSVRFYTSSQVLLYHGFDVEIPAINAAALFIACLFIARSMMRPGHFDMDVYPSQSALRGTITLALAGLYLLIAGALAKLITFVGGDAYFPLRALVVLVALVALAIVLQSDRVRMRIRHFVARHFKRPFFDYREVWTHLARGMAAHGDATGLSREVVRVLAKAFEAKLVSLWLADERTGSVVLGASSSLSSADGSETILTKDDAAVVLAHLRTTQQPFDLEGHRSAAVDILRSANPSEFDEGGGRACVPLHSHGETVGFLVLGDRVAGEPFSVQDFELFMCVGDHIASGLLNIRLSQHLIQAKEFEAFQTMATFFVHDLKNAANTLNLLLQNLPEHFHDPEFREDALRGCSKTVDHINDLVSRLTLLRQGLTLEPVVADLTSLVDRCLRDWPETTGIPLERDLQPLPPLRLDPDQISKVLVNLLSNAREALPGSGTVRVATRQRHGFAVVSVSDGGCGMSAEFVKNSLFRPFQTTKRRGLGIGMFQSKMIVEAHGGRIDVQSAAGKGSTIEMLLPLVGN